MDIASRRAIHNLSPCKHAGRGMDLCFVHGKKDSKDAWDLPVFMSEVDLAQSVLNCVWIFQLFWKKNSGETWCNSGVITRKSGVITRTTVF